MSLTDLRCRYAVIISLFIFLFGTFAAADTIHTKAGKEMRGVVVEYYRDRVVLATADGEVTVMKSDIRELVFDSEETNFIKIAEQALDGKRYLKAAGYYSKALKINPNSKEAKDGLLFLQLHLYDKEQLQKESDIRRKSDIDWDGSSIIREGNESDELKMSRKKLRKALGLVLGGDGNALIVKGVVPDSAAYSAGIRRNDIIAAIWGRLTGYMSVREAIDCLLKEASSEIRCTIERTVNIAVIPDRNAFSGTEDIIGASFIMEFDGLTVSNVKESGPARKAGLEKGDLIITIDNNPTRYMPLAKAIESIKNASEGIKMTLRRDTVIWGSHDRQL